jgi:Phosphoenolpyruvate carboxykinase
VSPLPRHRQSSEESSTPNFGYAGIVQHPTDILQDGMTNMNSFNLKEHELTVEEVFRNLSPSTLYEHAILYEKDAHIAENGALVAYSGVKTGRSPKDKRVVNQSPSKDEVCLGRS